MAEGDRCGALSAERLLHSLDVWKAPPNNAVFCEREGVSVRGVSGARVRVCVLHVVHYIQTGHSGISGYVAKTLLRLHKLMVGVTHCVVRPGHW